MIDAQSANATATFYEHAPTGDAGPYDDPDGDWTATHADVAVRYQPQQTATTGLVSAETGDVVARAEQLFAPLDIHGDLEAGQRVDVEHLGETLKRRIEDPAKRSFDGTEGYVVVVLGGWGD